MKYVYGFVIIILLGCSNNSIETIENKIDVNQLIELNNFRSIKVDSLFQILFQNLLLQQNIFPKKPFCNSIIYQRNSI